MTVILVVLTFTLFIAIDYALERRKARGTVAVPARGGTALVPALAGIPALLDEPVWVAGYQLPEELHYHRGHTWARILDDGTIAVGVDDFARQLIGEAHKVEAPAAGTRLEQGQSAFRIAAHGRTVDLVAPVGGEVVETNPRLGTQPQLATEEPYGRGWVLRLRSSELARGLRNLLDGSLARRWMEDSRERLELQLVALSGSVLQDGGEPAADFARHLPDADWRRLVHEFLLT